MSLNISEADKDKPWFRMLEESLENRLELLRQKNDKPASVEETAYLRGRISEVKSLLKDMGRPVLIKNDQAPQRRGDNYREV